MKYIDPFFITKLLFCPSARSFVHFSWHWWSALSSVNPQAWQPRMQETRNEDLHSHEMDLGALWWILILASLLLSNFCCYALCSSFATTLPTKVLHFVLFCNSCDVYLWPFKFHLQFLENCVTRAPLLHLRNWVALSFKVCQASVTSG